MDGSRQALGGIDERVAITKEMVMHALASNSKARLEAGGDIMKFLGKQTHLHLQGRKIEALVDLKALGLKSLEVLYLYDNHLQEVPLLSTLSVTLKFLYLQNNEIQSIEGLSELSSLTKLYLQGNRISVVTGLGNCSKLEELHLCGQRLPPDSDGLTFDLRSMMAVSKELKVFTASDCFITDASAASIPPLPSLRKLEMKGNQMEVIECLEVVLRGAPRLASLDLAGNPFCISRTAPVRYRDAVILMSSDSLKTLDAEEITTQQRSFLLKLNIMRLKKEMQMAAAAQP